MSSDCRPWFKWFPKEFMSDEKVRCLSLRENAIYRNLLDTMWQSSDCKLPNDIQSLFYASGAAMEMTIDEFQKFWARIQKTGFALFSSDDNWIWSKRLMKQHINCVEQSDKARAAILKRWSMEREKREKNDESFQSPNTDELRSNAERNTNESISNIQSQNQNQNKKESAVPPNHFENKIAIEYVESIKYFAEQSIRNLKFKKTKWNPFQFVQKHIQESKHPLAVIDALKQIAIDSSIENPWTYGNAVVKTNSGNYYERENSDQSNELKKNVNPAIAALMQNFGG